MASIEIEYEAGSASPDEIENSVVQFLSEFRGEVASSGDVDKAAVDADAADEVSAIEVSPGDPEGVTGLELVVITILITKAADVGGHVAESLWDDALLPALKRRLGRDALGRERKRRKKD